MQASGINKQPLFIIIIIIIKLSSNRSRALGVGD